MTLPRRRFLKIAAAAAALPALPRVARAQTYPSRTVRIIVATAAGGTTDLAARLIAQWLTDKLGQPFMVENRTGGSNNIGTEAAARRRPTATRCSWPTRSTPSTRRCFQNLSFNFSTDLIPVAIAMRSRAGAAGASVGAGQDGAGVHRLRQSQSRQDQHGLRRQGLDRRTCAASCSR